jgi:hypothetical protein
VVAVGCGGKWVLFEGALGPFGPPFSLLFRLIFLIFKRIPWPVGSPIFGLRGVGVCGGDILSRNLQFKGQSHSESPTLKVQEIIF